MYQIVFGLWIFVGLMIVWRGVRLYQKNKLLLSLPTIKLAGAHEGLVEIQGKIITPNDLISTHFKRPCVAFTAQEEALQDREMVWSENEKVTQRNDSSNWNIVSSSDRFNRVIEVNDGTHTVEINLAEGDLLLKEFLSKKNNIGNRRFTESVICSGEDIFAIGYLSKTVGPKGVMKLVLSANENSEMLVSNQIQKKVEKDLLSQGLGRIVGGSLWALFGAEIFVLIDNKASNINDPTLELITACNFVAIGLFAFYIFRNNSSKRYLVRSKKVTKNKISWEWGI